MRFFANRYIWIAALCTMVSQSVHVHASEESCPPKLMLWAWERSEDLHNVDASKVGIAVLAQTVTLRRNSVLVARRQQPLSKPHRVWITAVTRVEIDRLLGAELNERQLNETCSQIIRSAANAPAVQIDFDARVTERDFYKRLLRAVAKSLPPGKSMSVTSLASWSLYDNWLTDESIVHAVPMFFSMGAGSRDVLDKLRQGKQLLPLYRKAFGVSVSEPDTAMRVVNWARKHQPNATMYVFNSTPWSEKTINAALRLHHNYVQAAEP